MPAAIPSLVAPSDGECGLASWSPTDLAGLVLPAWDEFIAIASDVDLAAPTRLSGLTAGDLCIHLGSWPGARTLDRLRSEAERDDLDLADQRGGTFDQDAHNEAVLEAHRGDPPEVIVAALAASRDDVAAYLSSDEAAVLGQRWVRSSLGPLPMSTLAAAAPYELAVHALDLVPAGAPPPSPSLLSAGLAALVDT
ncbi:MAG: maleylpyruvate isomerase N-terminal domain-containing protein, partial [Actinomycetes bacterium]